MSTLQVTFDGRNYTFAPGATVRIGRSSENDIVVNDPTVSRRHAQLSWEASGWVWKNAGQAPTFLAGQPVAQFAVGQQVAVNLASPQGPVLQLGIAAAGASGPAGPAAQAGLSSRPARCTRTWPGRCPGTAPARRPGMPVPAARPRPRSPGPAPGWPRRTGTRPRRLSREHRGTARPRTSPGSRGTAGSQATRASQGTAASRATRAGLARAMTRRGIKPRATRAECRSRVTRARGRRRPACP